MDIMLFRSKQQPFIDAQEKKINSIYINLEMDSISDTIWFLRAGHSTWLQCSIPPRTWDTPMDWHGPEAES